MLANDGKADRLIMATDLLNARIRDIMCERRKNRLSDPTPTLADLEKTHILFINAHYKPFAALGYEYSKVRPASGNISWKSQVQFSIPAYGEFFSDMVVATQLGEVSCLAGKIPDFPDRIGITAGTKTVTQQISYKTDPANHTFTQYTQEYVNAAGEVQTVGSAATNFVRYCEYPGEMIFKEIKFEVNGNPLDTYTREATMFHRKFWVLGDKEVGWCRLMGQEVPVEGYSDLSAIEGASPFQAPMAGLTDIGNAVAIGAPALASMTARKMVNIVSGPQTPKAVQPALHLWVPLLFWFNRDIRLAIPSVSIPYGQRFITITIEDQANVVYPAPGNLFLRITAETRVDEDPGATTGTANAVDVVDISRQISYEPILLADSNVNTAQTMNMTLYVNNIFVNPEIHDIYIKRIGFSLIRVHRVQQEGVDGSSKSILLSQLKWPVEYIYVGILPAVNTSASNVNKYRDWHNLTFMQDEVLHQTSQSSFAVDTGAAGTAWGTNVKNVSCVSTSERITVPIPTPTIDTLKVTVHANDVINTMEAAFFRDYTPWYYGQNVLRTPKDLGALLINFTVYPGSYQPSGHINISRAREFYIEVVSSYCSAASPGTFLAVAIAINFLLISDGSAILRFTS